MYTIILLNAFCYTYSYLYDTYYAHSAFNISHLNNPVAPFVVGSDSCLKKLALMNNYFLAFLWGSVVVVAFPITHYVSHIHGNPSRAIYLSYNFWLVKTYQFVEKTFPSFALPVFLASLN